MKTEGKPKKLRTDHARRLTLWHLDAHERALIVHFFPR